MKMLVPSVLVTCAVLVSLGVQPSDTNAAVPFNWTARWIVPHDAEPTAFGVYCFRREFELDAIPATLIIHITADQRYRLLVNGQQAALGPCRGDLNHWRYETVDIAPLLRSGTNVVAATVWHMGEHTPVAQISHRVAFRLQAADHRFSLLDSGPDWRALRCLGYAPLPVDRTEVPYYYVVGPGERIDAASYPWGWTDAAYDDKDWPSATVLAHAEGRWKLVPRKLPAMEFRPERLQRVRRAEGVAASRGFVRGNAPITVPGHSSATILLDNGVLTNAYPRLTTSGGRGSSVALTYSESLWRSREQPTFGKGNRDEVEGKVMLGIHDEFLPDGGKHRVFRPLWFRTYRYLQLQIETANEPLVLEDIDAEFTGYPLVERAWFRSDDPELQEIWDASWRTLRLCANETLYDCPYYEQLQYVGDTRVQAWLIQYLTGDARLPRRAIQDFYDSIEADFVVPGVNGYSERAARGLTQSRYPSREPQSIPPYSLFWISMLYDDWQWHGDVAHIRPYLDGVRSVFSWFHDHMHDSGMLGFTPGWNFVDHSFFGTVYAGHDGPADAESRSAVLSLQLAYTYEQAADLMQACGESDDAVRYRDLAEKIKHATTANCWDNRRGLMADTPSKVTYSPHANIFALLAGAVPEAQQQSLMERIFYDQILQPQPTAYFHFYLDRALERTGPCDVYLETLGPWRRMLSQGLTTFVDEPKERSDCHAWSASPAMEMLRIIAGIKPLQPGFRHVEVAPSLGKLQFIDAGVPLSTGSLIVKLERAGRDGLAGTVTLPQNVTGIFKWNGTQVELETGTNQIAVD